MITVTGLGNEDFKLDEYSSAIILEPREHHDSSIVGYNKKEDRFMYCMQYFIEQLVDYGMTEQEACEWFYHNTLGTYVSNYPVFLDLEDGSISNFSGEYEYIGEDWKRVI